MEVELAGLAIILILTVVLDAIACAIPIRYIEDEFERLGVTPAQMRIIPAAKLLAAAGLLIGLWVPGIGVAACTGMIVYLGFAFAFHARAGDPVIKYLPAAGFMAFFAVVLLASYMPGV